MSRYIKKIAYVTGARSDFGIMVPVLREIQKSRSLQLRVYATGMHLMPEFGRTFGEVKKAFPDALSIRAIFRNDTPNATLLFAGDYLKRISEAFRRNRPDIVLVLGDRAEMLFCAIACHFLGIPIAHIHGGDSSGNNDEVTRHAITKLSHIHFPATREAAKRIRALGERPERICVVGAPGMDAIIHEPIPPAEEVFRLLKLPKFESFILLTLHPETAQYLDNGRRMAVVLSALKVVNLPVIAIYPNSDPGGVGMIQEIVRNRMSNRMWAFASLERHLFLGLAKAASVWVGNSSAAMIESAALRVPVVNIGTRQHGRQRGANVIDVDFFKPEVVRGIQRALNDAFLRKTRLSRNPWGDGRSSQKIVRFLERIESHQNLVEKWR